MTRKHLLFALMCLIWGLTWIAIKTGVTALPPFLFASSRFLVAGSLLIFLGRLYGGSSWPSHYWPRIAIAALLVNTACYGFLFWGMQHVSSGVSAVVNLALIPVGLFAIGLASHEESFSMRKLVSIGVGVLGLAILFLPKLSVQEEAPTLAGMAALVAGTLAYCWGSVLSRPLLKHIDTLSLSGFHSLIGGIALAALAFAFEPLDPTTLSSLLHHHRVCELAFPGSGRLGDRVHDLSRPAAGLGTEPGGALRFRLTGDRGGGGRWCLRGAVRRLRDGGLAHYARCCSVGVEPSQRGWHRSSDALPRTSCNALILLVSRGGIEPPTY